MRELERTALLESTPRALGRANGYRQFGPYERPSERDFPRPQEVSCTTGRVALPTLEQEGWGTSILLQGLEIG